ncbi:hypothetical protein LTR85_001223 [Meristemomyces frigidus]|nr:hypothetical protein LTR85_001223 [Meristemomyces frigidus]
MAPKALTERDANSAMASNANDPKRKRTETVDLTGDSSTDEEAPTQKAQKTASRINADRRKPQPKPTQSAATYQTPPASSAQPPPSSSAPGGSQRAFQRYPSSTSLGHGQHAESGRDAWLVGDDEAVDVDEIVSSTQDAAENDQLHKYGDKPTKIVGVQYYRGMANPGEYILMRREPGNPYDRNAIRIDNVGGTQIGHIPKRIVEKLAKYMDRGWLFCEGRLAGVVGQCDCPLEVDLYGPDPHSEAGRQLAAKMAADKLPTKALKEAERREKERQKQAE